MLFVTGGRVVGNRVGWVQGALEMWLDEEPTDHSRVGEPPLLSLFSAGEPIDCL